ncbi:MAG: hypothetical protein ABIA74_05125 [bacterium]
MIALGAGGGFLAGLGGGAAKKAGMESSLSNIAENIHLVTNVIILAILIAFIFFCFWVIHRIIKHSYYKKIKEIRNLFPKLKTDLIMFKNIKKLDDDDRLYVNNSVQEIIGKIKNDFDTHALHKKFSKEFCDKVLKYLDHIAKNDIDIEDQIRLIDCWIKMF